METMYAQALWEMVKRGMKPALAVKAMYQKLVAQGRSELMPRIGRALARLAARENARDRITLSVARESDARSAHQKAKEVIAELGVESKDVETAVDESLIGGWRIEGKEIL